MPEFERTIDRKPQTPSNRIILIAAVLVIGLILFSSCAHYRCDPAYTGPKPRAAKMLEYYSYPSQEIEAKVRIMAEKKKYTIKRVEFPSALNIFGTENIKIDYYQQKKSGQFPAVIILPVSGGIDYAVKSFARRFASAGFNCAIVHNRHADLDNTKNAEEVEDFFQQTVLDNRQVLDYLVQRPEVDKDRLGCLGLSLGGIKASLITAVDERIKCSVFGLAGGSIADVTITSREKDIKGTVKRFTDYDVSPEDIHTELTNKVTTDPFKLAEYVDAGNVLMFIAAFDRVVPRKCGDRLRNAIGKPETIYLPSGHYGSYLFLPYAEAKSLSFFKKKFEIK